MKNKIDYPRGTFLFAHGAGAGMDHAFMLEMSRLLEDAGLEVLRFEFPYMQKFRLDGKRRPPDRINVLLDYYRALIESQVSADRPLYIGGKSMGGRVASMLLEETEAAACFCFGYPFHPPKKPENLRTAHLLTSEKPIHIFQGTRDAMGSYEEVLNYGLPDAVQVHWLEDGDHDLKPRKASGFTWQQHLEQIACQVQERIS
ncbi:MAG: alpha/beta family hydrolase [Pontibacterium sp.]